MWFAGRRWVDRWYTAAIGYRVERWGADDGEHLIEIYHYTLICEIYCAAIKRQQREAGGATHTLKKHTHAYTHAHAGLPVGQ